MERKSKRLRGWQLEVEKEQCTSLTKGDSHPSALADKLLSLWAHGNLSAAAVQDLAHGAIQDGASHEELIALAKSGNWGSHKGSCHRDIMAYFCPKLSLCESWDIPVPCLDPKSGKETQADASLLLPHLMFWQLGLNHPVHFEKMFGIHELEAFWDHVEHCGDERLHGHPICLDKRPDLHGFVQEHYLDKRCVQEKERTIPIFCHGDGAEYETRDSLMIWSWGGLLNALPTLHSHMLLACYPKAATSPKTWDAFQVWLKWSFQALLSGYHPKVGPDGFPLPKGSIFEKMKGEPLHYNGFRCTIWSIQGDHEFYSNVLGLPHWQNPKPCWECDAMNPRRKKGAAKIPEGKSIKLLEEKDQKYVSVDTKAALTKGPPHLIFQVAGVTSRMVRGDMLHILFCRGVCSHLLGSLLHVLIYWDGKGKQKKPPNERLGLIFQEVQKHYKEVSAPVRLTNLKLSMVVDTKKPHASFPKLEAKGAETKHFCFSFLPVLKKLLTKDKEEHKHMIEALESLCGLVDFYDKTSMFLSNTEFAKSMSLGKRFFKAYAFLHQWALTKGFKLFHIVMKFHTLKHLITNGQVMNPRFCCNWKSESFVGKLAHLAHSSSNGVKSTNLSRKVVSKYRVLLYLKLTRPTFADEFYSQDDF